MLRLVAHEPTALTTRILDAARAICGQNVIDKLLTGSVAEEADLFTNAVAQPLICTAAVACWEALRAHGLPEPAVVAGYSVGELSAHAIAGTLVQSEDVLPLAQARARAMDDATTSGTPGGLLAVRGLSQSRVEEIAAAVGLEIAIINGADHFVLGGNEPALAEGERRFAQAAHGGSAGITVRRLEVGVPAHTSHLASAGEPFRHALMTADLRAPRLPVLAGINGALVHTAVDAIDTLTAQISRTIRWDRVLRAAWELGARVFLTLGPGCGFARIALAELPAGCEARAADEFRSLDGVVAWVRSRVED